MPGRKLGGSQPMLERRFGDEIQNCCANRHAVRVFFEIAFFQTGRVSEGPLSVIDHEFYLIQSDLLDLRVTLFDASDLLEEGILIAIIDNTGHIVYGPIDAVVS